MRYSGVKFIHPVKFMHPAYFLVIELKIITCQTVKTLFFKTMQSKLVCLNGLFIKIFCSTPWFGYLFGENFVVQVFDQKVLGKYLNFQCLIGDRLWRAAREVPD